jgi:hypothetical protein
MLNAPATEQNYTACLSSLGTPGNVTKAHLLLYLRLL